MSCSALRRLRRKCPRSWQAVNNISLKVAHRRLWPRRTVAIWVQSLHAAEVPRRRSQPHSGSPGGYQLEPCVLATGGLGGVHREAAATFDVSTDLEELARADGTLIVCSGVKSILDVPATFEVLESRGVLVVGYGTDELPGFLVRSTGLPLEHRVDTPEDAAAIIRAHRDIGLPARIVLVKPVPADHALDPDVLHAALDDALRQAAVRRISGKPLTPFLLDSIGRTTEGQSLRAQLRTFDFQCSSGGRGRCAPQGCDRHDKVKTIEKSSGIRSVPATRTNRRRRAREFHRFAIIPAAVRGERHASGGFSRGIHWTECNALDHPLDAGFGM